MNGAGVWYVYGFMRRGAWCLVGALALGCSGDGAANLFGAGSGADAGGGGDAATVVTLDAVSPGEDATTGVDGASPGTGGAVSSGGASAGGTSGASTGGHVASGGAAGAATGGAGGSSSTGGASTVYADDLGECPACSNPADVCTYQVDTSVTPPLKRCGCMKNASCQLDCGLARCPVCPVGQEPWRCCGDTSPAKCGCTPKGVYPGAVCN